MKYQFTMLSQRKQFSAQQFKNLNLFDGDTFFGRLLCFQRGQQVSAHVHAHKDECFDVVEGEGTLLVDGRELHAGPGAFLYVPAGVTHGLRADISEQWVLRETVSERVYARRALWLLWCAVLKRLPIVGKRWR
jgi:quercetin dioxygenase-like cupin family protein